MKPYASDKGWQASQSAAYGAALALCARISLVRATRRDTPGRPDRDARRSLIPEVLHGYRQE